MPAPSSAIFFERQLQLQTAIAAQRAEDVSGEALRVNAHQRRRGVNVAHHQRNQALDDLVLDVRGRLDTLMG
jgi:hypothetical protein